jgi:hypothetical protein
MKSEDRKPRSEVTRSSLMRAAEKLFADNMLIDAMAGLLAAEVSAQTRKALASTKLCSDPYSDPKSRSS